MKIAIQGHPIRGKEVIQILESLGGINIEGLTGTYETFYYINNNNEIDDDHKKNLQSNYKLYTLEEFEKEFPFKVGNKVTHPLYDKPFTIIELNPTSEFPYVLQNEEAEFNAKSKILTKYKKKKTVETRTINLSIDKAKEWYKKGEELKEIALQAFTEKELTKVELPETWEEFCKNTLNINWSDHAINSAIITPTQEHCKQYKVLMKLHQLRDCYRQEWVPNWNNYTEIKWIIRFSNNKLNVTNSTATSFFLSFPTKELAEQFLNNFKDLIIEAGDLI